ncbi:MAG: hypothetical protein ACOCP4_06125, partial [Candidatus Woesearchaeota archaeon]
RIFQLSPRFITVYVKEYLSGNASKYNNNFSTVFLNNIYNTISDALVKDGTKKEIKMDVLIALYSKIAFESYIDKSYPISYLKITKTVNEFFEAKGLVGFSKNQYTRALFSSNIFMESSSNNSYVFSSTSYLAYFIARHIYGFFFKSKGREMVNDLIDNIDIRINDDIILFLTFLLGDQGDEILLEVIDNANNFMADWEELDLDEINIRFLKNVKESIKLPQPNEQDVVEKNRIQNEIENETLEDRELNHVNVFEREHEKKSVIDSIKAYKSIEFISKVMPDLLINLDEKDKIKVINAYYSYPNKMLYNLFSQIDNNFDKVLLNLKKMINEHENSDENIDKKMESLITYISQIIIASVYSFETDIGITDENLLLILKHSKDSATHNLMNIFAYAKLEMTKELLDKALKLKKSENAIINQVLSFAVASLFIDSPKLMYKSDSTTSKLRQYFLEHDPKKVKAIKDRKSI